MDSLKWSTTSQCVWSDHGTSRTSTMTVSKDKTSRVNNNDFCVRSKGKGNLGERKGKVSFPFPFDLMLKVVAVVVLRSFASLKYEGRTPWFEFLVIFDFFHYGIEEKERHLLWKFHKKIQRKSWSNLPPKLLTCIGFLYKVVPKNGRLRKFNRPRD